MYKIVFALAMALACVGSVLAAAATLTWTGASGDGLWSTAGNWSPAQVPVKGDNVIFSGNLGTKGASVIDAAFAAESVYTLVINADFTGSVTLGRSFWVTRTFDMSAGTFTCGDYDFTVGVLEGANRTDTQINFFHRNGTFNCPSGVLEMRRSYPVSYFYTTNGVWNANGGTLRFNIRSSGNSHAFHAYGRTFCNLDFSKDSASSCVISVKGTNYVSGTMKFQCGGLRPAATGAAVFHAQGDLYLGGQSGGGAAEIWVDGTGDQHIYGDDKGGTSRNAGARCCTLHLNKPSGKVVAGGETISFGTDNNGCAGLLIHRGEVDLSAVGRMGIYLYMGVPLSVWPAAEVSWPQSLTLMSDIDTKLLYASGQTFNDITFLHPGQSTWPNSVTNTVLGTLTFNGTSLEPGAVTSDCIPQSKGSSVQGALIVKGDVYWKKGGSTPGGGVPLIFVGDKHQYLRTETDDTCVTKLLIRKAPGSVLTAVGEQGGVVRLGCSRTATTASGDMFLLESGTFEFPSSCFDVAAINVGTVRQTGGKLVTGKSKLRVSNAANSTIGPLLDPLWDYTVSQTSGNWINSGSDTLVVSNDFAFLGGQFRGSQTIKIGGDLTMGADIGDPTYVTMNVQLVGNHDQTVSCTNLTRNTTGTVTIDKTDGTVAFDTDFYYRNHNNCKLDWKAGAIRPNGHRLLLRNLDVGNAATLAFNPPQLGDAMIETTGTLSFKDTAGIKVLPKIGVGTPTRVNLFSYATVSGFDADKFAFDVPQRVRRSAVANDTDDKIIYYTYMFGRGLCLSVR